ncbi:MAG TPA: STAS domain-containing protein [Planctomycetota bacterium]|nr:STAS domain-containing protein [Planctomycetota bacterium]
MAMLRMDTMLVGRGGVTVVRPAGWMTADGATELEEHLKRLIDEGQKRIVVDLSSAHFVGSTGLGVLIYYRKLLEDRGGCFLLACPTSSIRRILFTTRLGKALENCDTVAEAVQLATEKCSSGRHQAPVTTA